MARRGLGTARHPQQKRPSETLRAGRERGLERSRRESPPPFFFSLLPSFAASELRGPSWTTSSPRRRRPSKRGVCICIRKEEGKKSVLCKVRDVPSGGLLSARSRNGAKTPTSFGPGAQGRRRERESSPLFGRSGLVQRWPCKRSLSKVRWADSTPSSFNRDYADASSSFSYLFCRLRMNQATMTQAFTSEARRKLLSLRPFLCAVGSHGQELEIRGQSVREQTQVQAPSSWPRPMILRSPKKRDKEVGPKRRCSLIVRREQNRASRARPRAPRLRPRLRSFAFLGCPRPPSSRSRHRWATWRKASARPSASFSRP